MRTKRKQQQTADLFTPVSRQTQYRNKVHCKQTILTVNGNVESANVKHSFNKSNKQLCCRKEEVRCFVSVSSQLQQYKTSSRVFYCQLYRLQIYHYVQLNVLFCCLWHNVEASCRKHSVVFSRNQQCRLLPAMCHNLCEWPWSTSDHVDNTQPIAALTPAVKPDIGSEQRFLPTPPAFDAPVMGVPIGILLCRLARKNQNGVATRQ